MKISRQAPQTFLVEFESEAELREEHRANLSMGGLRLPTTEKLALFSSVRLTLRGPLGAEAAVTARVVAPLPDGAALSIEESPGPLLERLLERAREEPTEKDGSAWDRFRSMPRTEKIILAGKAERGDRIFLLQDNDPQVLYSILKNPRLTVDEVVRVAKSPFVNYQAVEVIMKSTVWMANLDVRVALIHNPRTPTHFCLKILPTLPESEVRTISRGAATSMALKTAALKRLQAAF